MDFDLNKYLPSRSEIAMRPSVRRFAGFGLLVLGVLVLWFMSLSPLIHLRQTQSWVRVPCKISSSGFELDNNLNEREYHFRFAYRYSYEDQVFTRFYYNYEILTPSRKAWITNNYTENQETFCYVDSANPSDAVLSTEFTYGYLVGFVGLIFIFSGFLLYYSAWNAGRRKILRKKYQWGEGEILKSAINPSMNIAVGASFAAVLFIVGWYLWYSMGWYQRIAMSTTMLIPPILLVTLSITSLMSPKIHVRLKPGLKIHVGSNIHIYWIVQGSTNHMKDFCVWLEGQKVQTFQADTSDMEGVAIASSKTRSNIFHEEELASHTNPARMARGHVEYYVPTNLQLSKKWPTGSIMWTLRFRGRIPLWPDLNEEFRVTIASPRA